MNKGEGEEELMDFGSAYCEICAATYKMKIVYGNIFNCAQGFKEHLTALKIAFVSFILCSLLAFILFFFFFTPYKENHLKEGFKFAIIFCCVIVFLLFFLILVLSLREAFYYEKIVEWQIFNYENNQ
jgi:Na+-driven multidrug efflux pump